MKENSNMGGNNPSKWSIIIKVGEKRLTTFKCKNEKDYNPKNGE